MTNNEIIRAGVQRTFTPAQIHDLAVAYCDLQQIAARAAVTTVTDADGNEIDPMPIVELDFVAAQFHTIGEWNKAGRCVKRGQKSAFRTKIWQYTNKPSAAARKAAAENGTELADDPHFYLASAWFFHFGQTEPQAAAPEKMSAEDLKAKNAQLMAAYKARRAAEKAAAPQQPAAQNAENATAKPATKPATKPAAKPATKPETKPAAPAVAVAMVEPDFAALAASILF